MSQTYHLQSDLVRRKLLILIVGSKCGIFAGTCALTPLLYLYTTTIAYDSVVTWDHWRGHIQVKLNAGPAKRCVAAFIDNADNVTCRTMCSTQAPALL